MTLTEIADLLRSHSRAKEKTREAKAELLRVAVEQLGIDQKYALSINIENFLDGYLTGKGMSPACHDRSEPC